MDPLSKMCVYSCNNSSSQKIFASCQDQIFEAEIESHKLLALVDYKIGLPPIGSKPISECVNSYSIVDILVDD